MNSWDTFWAGIAPDHAAALVLTALLPGLWWLHRALTVPAPSPGPLSLTDRWAIGGLAATSCLHLALPVGHHDDVLLTVGFLASGAAYAWLAVRVVRGRAWRAYTAVLVAATLLAYLVVVTAGGEEPDQVGIVTALDELLLLGLALGAPRGRRVARAAGAAATVAAVVVVGAGVWIGSLAAHLNPEAATDAAEVGATTAGHGHHDDHAARAQAGIIMRPLGEDHQPDPDQTRAAAELAAATTADTARYRDIRTALADGYQPTGKLAGTQVHLENKANKQDTTVLDPQHPEALVYVVADGRAALLGAVFMMPSAGRPGPTPGGSTTRWHAHNVCLTPLPPGFGLVSPFGGCPGPSVALTMPEMMHLWVAGNPGGPYAESIDNTWARTYNTEHGLPWQPTP